MDENNSTDNITVSLPTMTFPNPVARFSNYYKRILSKVSQLAFNSFHNSFTNRRRFNFVSGFSSLSGFKGGNFFSRKRAGVAVIIVLILGIVYFSKDFLTSPLGGTSDGRFEVAGAKAMTTLNREFQFPLKNEKGEELSRIKYLIENIEKKDEIIVKGKRATSVKGRTFLVINLKLANDYNKSIKMNTKDYVRLTTNNSTEQLAADIHNDPVEIQPISVKFTRLAFPINDTDKDLKLIVGEINGEKTTLDVNF